MKYVFLSWKCYKMFCPSFHEKLYSLEDEKIICYVQCFHFNVVLLVFGKKHILTWFFDLLCPSEYFYIIVCDFNKWNEKPLKVSAQTPEEKHPFWYMHSLANICRTQTKCQVGFQLLEMQREQNSDFLAWMLNEAA